MMNLGGFLRYCLLPHLTLLSIAHRFIDQWMISKAAAYPKMARKIFFRLSPIAHIIAQQLQKKKHHVTKGINNVTNNASMIQNPQAHWSVSALIQEHGSAAPSTPLGCFPNHRYNPASTVDALDRARAKGNYVDLVTKSSSSLSNTRGNIATTSNKKRKRDNVEKFSVPEGKRRQIALHTANVATYCATLEQRWEQGAFRWVHKGRYEQDPRRPHDTRAKVQIGKLCVLKEFKTGSVYEDSFFSKDILAVEKAASIIAQFNQYVLTHKQPEWNGAKTIRLNRPKIWETAGVNPLETWGNPWSPLYEQCNDYCIKK